MGRIASQVVEELDEVGAKVEEAMRDASPEARSYLEKAFTNLLPMRRYLNGLHLFFQDEVEGGKAEYNLHEMMESIIDEIRSRCEVMFGSEYIPILSFEAQSNPIGYGRATFVEQALYNIAWNGVWHNDREDIHPNQRRLDIGLGTTDDIFAVVNIRDNGPGMSEDDLGNGRIGLQFAYRVVKQERGMIYFEAGSQGGTTFEVKLPLKRG